MASTINADNGAISGSAGVKTTADSSGVLELQANGTTNFTLGASSVVINESGADVDTRIEGDTDANLFFVDASTDRIGIGTSSPTNKLEVATTTTNAGITIYNSNGSGGLNARLGFKSLNGYDATSVLAAVTAVPTSSSNTATALTFATSGDNSIASAGLTERARITAAGSLLINRTTTDPNTASFIQLTSTANSYSFLSAASGGTAGYVALFLNSSGTTVGSITTDGSNTTYSTSSDARLKKNIVNAQDSGSDIDALQVRSFDWKIDDSHVKYGFVAQELFTVAPEAVKVGDPDDVEKLKDPWGVDYSKLVPMLVKEIQSLRVRSAALEAEVAALKAR